jgi:DNA-3-methyladenine glycosylase I
MTDYQTIFNKVESTLIRVGSQNIPQEIVRKNLDEFKKIASKKFTNTDYFQVLIYVPFYSGFKADTVNNRMDTIRKYFSDYKIVAGYDLKKISEILGDSQMIRHKGKIQASVDNARTFKAIIEQYGSFQTYIDSFAPKASFENLMRLRQDLRRRFRYLGKITVYHFLTDIGMPVLKPDRVIRRIFCRLGLVESEGESEEQLLKAVSQGHKFAQETGYPIRYIDIIFVAYGQVQSEGFGIEQGICLKDDPQCNICGVSQYCNYFAQKVRSKRR